jgi:hypothetical protein
VRSANKQAVLELAQRVSDLTMRVAELTRRVELSEGVGGNGARNQKADAVVHYEEDSSNPIEFLTENGFSIIRPWETGRSPAPTDGKCSFRVSDTSLHERDVVVEISSRVVLETALHTRGRIQHNSSFWICCAERHLANYLMEHAALPDENNLIVEFLDPEEVLLAVRWERSD